MTRPVGIDDLNLYAGPLAVEIADLAAARGFSDRALQQIQFARRSVIPPFEDPVTLAVNAAKPLVETAGRQTFGLLIVATETGLDYGKPLSTYVHRYLGLDDGCRNFEIKHACYAGTAALQMATAWLRSQSEETDQRALVIMTDLARRHFDRPGELTTGSGAVALSVAAGPRVLVVDGCAGCATREVYDIARPTATAQWDDPALSLAAYLDLLEIAWDRYRRAAGPVRFEEHFAYMLYHTPLVSLIEQAHQLLLETDRPQASAAEARASFERMVRPSLLHNREIGNIYSGSIYAALAGLVDSRPPPVEGARVGLFSYGSGACAEIYSARVGPEAPAVVGARGIVAHLAARRRASVAEYEAAALELERSLSVAEYRPDRERWADDFEHAYAGRHLLVLEEVSNYYRRYGWS